MARLCDVYCNDAFGTAHRAEATTHVHARAMRRSPARARCWRRSSTRSARRSTSPQRPLVAIVAGAKVSTKLTILRALAAKVDTLIVGGGIANTFMLAAGGRIGKSLAEADLVDEARAILDEMPAAQGARCRSTSCARSASPPTRTPTMKAVDDVARRRPDPRHRPADRRDAAPA